AVAIAIGAFVVLAAVLALLLKWRVVGELSWTDVVIPALLLTPRQWELFVASPNPSHSAMPLVLLLLLALARTIRSRGLRDALLIVIDFGAVFTGFGFFIGVLTP